MTRPGSALAAACGLVAIAVVATAAVQAAGPAELSVSAFNGRYSQPGVSFDGVAMGPLALHLSSPENALYVDSHRLLLSPLGDGTHSAELTAAVRGGGRLLADVDVGGAPSRMADEVVLPPQTVTVEGRARLTRVEGGYQIALLQLPESVGVEIESALADRLVTVCDGLQILTLGTLDCAALERSLHTVQVPLPASGQTLFLDDGQVTAEERQALDLYLAGGAASDRVTQR